MSLPTALLSALQVEDGLLGTDSFSFPSLLKAASRTSGLIEGKEIHGIAAKLCFDKDPFVRMGLVGLYYQSGLYDDVLQLFEEMRNSNLKPGEKSALVTMYASCGCLDIAEELFTKISTKNLVVLSFNSHGFWVFESWES
ncbi:hypothetical protein POPTR_008G154301v4 [Populus trichocarpa]|uniref:Uncharacterized protein n=1 Tax=Populus trichocarpa TaxID=3694 RepID=A0ACC0SLZ3_POPTR|nr:hypothetical protein POPTR_008G154301v4 [Populus trichocarpa]